MPEGNVFLCGVAVVEELAVVFAVVLAVASTMEGFFDRRWSHFGIRRDIATIAYQSGSANMQEKADQKVVWC
jgi:hypothetical protein